MIYQINKYHKTANGETASSVKIEKADATEAYETAMRDYYQFASNYMADASVVAWQLSIIQPSDMTVKAHCGYAKPVEEEQTAE